MSTRRLDRKRRSRSRSRERERSPQRYITGEVTNDPSTISARIFIGSLTSTITRSDIEDEFSKFGTITGITLTKNKFGFVQFSKDSEAAACLDQGPYVIVAGSRIDVKPARVGGAGGPPPPSSGFGNRGRPPRGMDQYGDRPNRPPFVEQERSPPRKGDYYDSYFRDRRRDDEYNQFSDYYNRDYYAPQENDYAERARAPHAEPTESAYSRDRAPVCDTYRTNSEPSDPLDPSRPNDVEIVVPNKMQRGYAEMVEAELKKYNMLVDLLFPPPDIMPSRVLSDLSTRRCLYAVFVTPDNEKHRSVTVNILRGKPQEHRNMPVEDALRLIQVNFEEYVKKTCQRNMREVVPRDVRNLLIDLLEMRPLSMGDLDRIIKYLRERQNALVDDQIEMKRETAVQSGLSVLTQWGGTPHRTEQFIGSGVQQSLTNAMAVTYPGYEAVAGAAVSQPAPLPNIYSNSSASAQVGLPTPSASTVRMVPASLVGSVSYPPVPAYSVSYGIATTQSIPVHPVQPVPQPDAKQSELQERILNLMKSRQNSMSGVMPPTGVPPPSAVPPPQMGGMGIAGPKMLEQTNSMPYNPWAP